MKTGTNTKISRAIRTAHICEKDEKKAATEFYTALAQPDIELVIFFCSGEYNLPVLAREIKRLFAGVQVAGCTTSGEIGYEGYQTHSLAGASLPRDKFLAVCGVLENLSRFNSARCPGMIESLMQRIMSKSAAISELNTFAFMMIDGLSSREESIARALQAGLGKIKLLGGSAGSCIYYDGRFYADSVLVVLVSTPLPFSVFKTQHFISSRKRMLVTEADPAKRTVSEINGRPAAGEYARLLGLEAEDLTPAIFAASPVLAQIKGTSFVRSIQKAEPDGSLLFSCAIEEGMLLRLAHSVDLLHNLEETFENIHASIGQPELVLGCECVLRSSEILETAQNYPVAELFRHNNTLAFSSHGEQFLGIQANQTFTGIAIGAEQKI